MIGAPAFALSRERTLPHSLDNNACCEYCGFDAAEGYHQLVLITPDHLQVRMPDYARFCEERRKVMREVVGNEKARL
ncbi:MAG TPA: hypothetical protein VF800_02745 [Telluria sp.]|jgi:hypothetical protein